MKNVPALFATTILAALLASCASSTMDSVPTVAELAKYEHIIRARLQPEYAALDQQRTSGRMSPEEYADAKRRLDAKVSSEVNNAAWQKHYLAESERKANGVPTPDAPVALRSGMFQGGGFGMAGSISGGGGSNSFYQPMTKQNFGNAIGTGGTAGMGSMSAAREQFFNAQSARNDAMSAGGTYLSQPQPGSIYDERRR